jgi:hypothetical protein
MSHCSGHTLFEAESSLISVFNSALYSMVCPEELSVDEPLFRPWRIQNRSRVTLDCLQSPVSVYSTMYSSLQTLRPSAQLLLYLNGV